MKYTFTCQTNDPTVHTIYVAGNFNSWLNSVNGKIIGDHSAYKMKSLDSNIYTLELELPPGKYEFKYVINGEKWVNDENLEKTNDQYGNSILSIGASNSNTLSSLASSNSGWKEEEKPQAIFVQHDSGQKLLQKYEANEHKEIGNHAFEIFFTKNQDLKRNLFQINPETYIIELTDEVQLEAGEWVALAGDFYGIPDQPISGLPDETVTFDESKKRFKAAYNCLANIKTEKEIEELEALREEIEKEVELVKETVKKGENIPKALHKHAKTSNSKYAEITANNILIKFLAFHLPIAIVGLTLYTRYLALAANNYDHFGQDAERAYEAGHAVACQTAEEAYQKSQEGKTEEAKSLLIKALTQELFACHFLTDLFAAGHLRVPRKALYRHAGSAKIAGALSLMMHNEDGEKGLIVHKRGDKTTNWKMKGDSCLYDADAEENHKRAIEAVAAALQFIYETYKDPVKANKFDFKDHIPVYDSILNTDALFVSEDDKTVMRRKELASPSASTKKATPTKDWHAIPTLAELWFMNKNHLPKDDQHQTAEEFEQEVMAELTAVQSEETEEITKSKRCTII